MGPEYVSTHKVTTSRRAGPRQQAHRVHRRPRCAGRGRAHAAPGLAADAAVREQGQRLLELLVAPVQLLHLDLMLRPHPAQLLQEVLIGADQGAGGKHGGGDVT